MSKIKLTGENSGYVELSAGQNAGNNTLELPTSGTKVVASDDSNNVNLGIVTATTFSGNVEGNVTGNLTGNITGNITGNVTGDVTANQITVGDKFINSSGVGLGQTTTAGRDAGIGTAIGTLIYNSTTSTMEVYDGSGWKSSATEGQFIQATGGTTQEYFSGEVKYRVHSFYTSDTFNVSYVSSLNNTIEYLVVGAGGGGGHSNVDGTQSSGGGAGGFKTGIGYTVSATPGSYTCLLYTSPSPRDKRQSRMPSSA